MTAARPIFADFNIMEMDPTQELEGHSTIRRKDRKQPLIPVSSISFLPALFVFIDCYLPSCRGHQKYGIVEGENIPVIFKYHDFNEEPAYVAYKSRLSRPFRVPLTGDVLTNGIKWGLDPKCITPTIQCVFDCFMANLKLQSLSTKSFCLECLFCYPNGTGALLEKFLRTVLYHIISFGRYLDKDFFRPVIKYEKGMNLRFRRVFWENKNKMFKSCCVVTKCAIQEEVFYGTPGEIDLNYVTPPSYGEYANPELTFLKHMDTVSFFHASTVCGCNSGKPYPIKVFVHLIRRHPRSGTLSMAPARWDNEGSDYLDPIWTWSLFGPKSVNKAVYTHSLAVPISSVCTVCNQMISISNFIVPSTTWCLIADVPHVLHKVSADYFMSISSFVVNDVVFDLNFILMYNTSNGAFTSVHLFENQWFYFDDMAGGMMKRCNVAKIKNRNRIILRLFYFRRTETKPHVCLLNATRSSRP